MKRLLCVLFALLLLTGCGANAGVSETTAPSTEPAVSWIEQFGQPWDTEGALKELPLTIPNGMIYSSYMVFDGDLMLWSQDDHRLDHSTTEICIVDLDAGKVLSQAEIPVSTSMMPQVLGDSLYLIDNETGTILQLDKYLNEVDRWHLDFTESALYMAGNGTAYVSNWGETAYAVDLETGAQKPILDADSDLSYLDVSTQYLKVTYYHPDSGEECNAFIDLHTLERYDPPIQSSSNCELLDGVFLLNDYDDSYEYTLIPSEGDPLTVHLGYDYLRLLDGGQLLRISDENNQLSIHDLSGKSLVQCTISERDYGYETIELIPSEAYGGYYVLLFNYGGGMRLLYWDVTKSAPGEDIPFAPIPSPTEQEAQIQQRISRIEEEYGLNILAGVEAQDYFYDFEAEVVTDFGDILDALDVLEDALEDYPANFFRQLRYGDIHRTEIHLMGTLTPTNSQYTDTYAAFVQEGYDEHVMVMDIYVSDETTYYHEFSHIIDSFLEWDALNREDALFSDEQWCSLNPGWFPGYTYDYSWEQYVEDYAAFVDSYSTINPTEDRARVLEYAMADYGQWTFEDAKVLLKKLDYYCRCIRDAFDTTGWPERVLWEQYLP